MKKLILVLVFLTIAIMSSAQTVFYTDRALGVNPFSTSPGGNPLPAFLSYAQVRVCTYSVSPGSPCTPVATITDAFGNPLTIVGGNFGQLTTDVVGRFSIGCSPGIYIIQVAATGSNTPQLQYPFTCPSGTSALLSSANVWSGTNTFNALTTFNGTATFTGTVNLPAGSFANLLSANNTWSGTNSYSQQITSTLAPGTPPFVLASGTKVVNLNADQVDGGDWAIPNPLGSTTPNTGTFTTLTETAGLTISGGVSGANTVGNSGKVQLAGTVAGSAGALICDDGAHNTTTTGCPSLAVTKIQTIISASNCTTTSGSYDFCSNTLSWPVPFADAAYAVSCIGIDAGINGGTPDAPTLNLTAQVAASITVVTQTQRTQTAHYSQITCLGIHP